MKRSLTLTFLLVLSGCLFGPSADVAPDLNNGTNNQNNLNNDNNDNNLNNACNFGTICDNECVTTTNDPGNCGECGVRCSPPPFSRSDGCVAGECVYVCEAGTADDDGDLYDRNSNGCEGTCVVMGMETDECDGVDNDCDGEIDEDAVIPFFVDADADGFGDPDSMILACVQPDDAYTTMGGDCNDIEPSIFPGAPEICDGIKQDCLANNVDDGLDIVACTDPRSANGVCVDAAFECTPASFVPYRDAVDGMCEGSTYLAHNQDFENAETKCGDNLDNDCDGLTDCGDPDCDASTECNFYRVFVSVSAFNATSFGSLETTCAAEGAQVDPNATFVPLASRQLMNNNQGPAEFIDDTKTVKLLNGTTVATPGNLFVTRTSPINVARDLSMVNSSIWTSADNDGTFMSSCLDGNGVGTSFGNSGSNTEWMRTLAFTPVCVGALARVYCIEQ